MGNKESRIKSKEEKTKKIKKERGKNGTKI